MREYATYLAKYYVNFSCYFVFTTTLSYLILDVHINELDLNKCELLINMYTVVITPKCVT
jgi:hypothetical protein